MKSINDNRKFSNIEDFHEYWSQHHLIISPNKRFLNIVIDICNVCNLRCRFCYLSSGHKQPEPIFHTPEVLQQDLEDILPFTRLLRLSCGYEPLMSPNFIDILKMLAKFKIPNLELVTNAMLLSPDKIDAIIQYGVTNLMFSLDTPDKKTYEYIRRGARFENVLENIRRLQSRKRDLHSKTPSLTLIAVLMHGTIHKMDALVDLAKELGVDNMDLRHLDVYDGLEMGGEKLGPETQEMSDPILNQIRDKALEKRISLIIPKNYGQPYSPTIRIRLLRRGLHFSNALNKPSKALGRLKDKLTGKLTRLSSPQSLTIESIYCTMPFNHIFVSMDGRVMACPYVDDLRDSVLCDNPQKLVNVFLGDKFHNLREGLINLEPPEKCLHCPHCRLYALNQEVQDSK
jgi:MoaA/NifB/PqqE/SkfB family radical SAM enzyme